MIRLIEYINESSIVTEKKQYVTPKATNKIKTKNGKDRKELMQNAEEIKKELGGKKYSEYIKSLDRFIKDEKIAPLVDAFGGDLSNTPLEFNVGLIPVTGLKPTQSEIDIKNSIDFPLAFPKKNIENYYSNKVIVNSTPIVTFADRFIIDGHHRWSQVFAFNSKAKMVTFNYDNKELSPDEVLKATQGAIAATIGTRDGENGSMPSSKVPTDKVIVKVGKEKKELPRNIYDDAWGLEEIKSYIVTKLYSEYDFGDTKIGKNYKELVDTYQEVNPDIFENIKTSKESDEEKYYKEATKLAAEYIAKNLMRLKNNNEPVYGAPSRAEMPQTDQAGTNPQQSKKTSNPDDNGSALNRLKNGVYDDAVK